MLVAKNSLSKEYPHPIDHDKQITDAPEFKPFTMTHIFFLKKRPQWNHIEMQICRLSLITITA